MDASTILSIILVVFLIVILILLIVAVVLAYTAGDPQAMDSSLNIPVAVNGRLGLDSVDVKMTYRNKSFTNQPNNVLIQENIQAVITAAPELASWQTIAQSVTNSIKGLFPVSGISTQIVFGDETAVFTYGNIRSVNQFD